MSQETQSFNPYIGLRPFDRADSLYFFGRREQTTELLERLHASHFLAVVGSSGCGKSSLIRAGLIPALLGGFLVEERDKWRIAVMKPGDAPLRNFAVALCNADEREPEAAEIAALEEVITHDYTPAVVSHLLPRLGEDSNLLLLVDQFEEIFTFRGVRSTERLARLDPALGAEQARRRVEAAEFVDLIINLSKRSDLPVYTTLTMRTDFLGDCDLFYGLPEAMNRGRYLVPRLSRQQLREAIEGPALLAGRQIAPRLLDRLLNELGDRTDRLPVLQHALLRTWEAWQREGGDSLVDLEHYEAAGTLGKALSIHADEALRDEDFEATKQIFKCLVDTDPNYRRVRRAAAMSELMAVSGLDRPAVEAILERFRAGGRHFVFVSEGEQPGDPRVEICHESLMRRWDRLSEWTDEERHSRDRFIELVRGARREAAGRAALMRDPDLRIALDWRETARPGAAWARRYIRKEDDFAAAMDYLDRSRDAAEAAARRSRRNKDLLIVATVAVVAVLTLLWWRAEDAARRARHQAKVAAAGEWLTRDPTRAALVLLELENPEETYAAQRMYQALDHKLADLALEGHLGGVRAATFNHDATRVVTASEDKTARIWDAATGAEVKKLEGHEKAVVTASFSGDGTRVVTASDDGTARIWNATTGAEVATLEGHTREISAASFSHDGTRVVTAAWDEEARIWNAATGAAEMPLRGHEGLILAASFSGDDTRVVTASEDGTARIWDAATGAEVAKLEGHEKAVVTASFSGDGTRVVTASDDGTARIWDAATGALVRTLAGHEKRVSAASFSRDGTRVVTASDDRTASIWDVATGTEVLPLEGHTGEIFAASFDADGTRVLTASTDRTARIWSAESGRSAELMGHEDAVSTASFSRDGSRVVTASRDRTVRIWSLASGVEVAKLEGHEERILSASFDPDGSRVLTASYDGTARIWNAASARETVRLEHDLKQVEAASFSRDGSRVVTASRDGMARIWDAASGDLVAELTPGHEDSVFAAELSRDGSRVVTASRDRTARIWDLRSKREPVTLEGHTGWVYTASFNPDGTRVVTASEDGTARIWEAATGAEVRVLDEHTGSVSAAEFSPDGSRVVTASEDNTARVWEASSGARVALLEHTRPVTCASFSDDGSRIATSSEDRTARIWDSESGDELATLDGHEGAVQSAGFSPDGSWVVTASDDATARIWDSKSGAEVAKLVGHEDRVLSAEFSPDGSWVVTAAEDHTSRIWLAPGERLEALIRQRTSFCLDAGFREQALAEARPVAEKKKKACERCLEVFRRQRPQASQVDLLALREYKKCLRKARR